MTPTEAITTAIYQRLSNDVGLLALLDHEGDGGMWEDFAKVFVTRPVDDAVPEPLVLLSGPVAGPGESASLGSSRSLRRQGRHVQIFMPNLGDPAPIDRAAEYVRALLHRVPLDLFAAGALLRRVNAEEATEIPGDKVGSLARQVDVVVHFVA